MGMMELKRIEQSYEPLYDRSKYGPQYSMYQILKAEGFEFKRVIGGVGRSGQKIHAMSIEVKPDGRGNLKLASAYTVCGSDFGNMRRHSGCHSFYEYNEDHINCERCMKKLRLGKWGSAK